MNSLVTHSISKPERAEGRQQAFLHSWKPGFLHKTLNLWLLSLCYKVQGEELTTQDGQSRGGKGVAILLGLQHYSQTLSLLPSGSNVLLGGLPSAFRTLAIHSCCYNLLAPRSL